MLLQSCGMQKDGLGEQGPSALGTSGCSQLGLCSRGVGGQPLRLPTVHARVLAHACLHAATRCLLALEPAGTAGAGNSLQNPEIKLLKLLRNQHVLLNPKGSDRKTAEDLLGRIFAQRRPAESSPKKPSM